MSTIAEKVGALVGSPLHTLHQEKPFTIMSVEEGIVRIRNSKGKRRAILLERIEAMASMGYQREEYRQRTQKEYPESRNTSYIAAIAHAVASCQEGLVSIS